MVWNEAMKFRDCPWCGLSHAQMQVLAKATKANRDQGGSRYYTLVACPECAGPVVVEHDHPNASPGTVLSVTPTGNLDETVVEHLPEDVARYFADAHRVLRAGVPDAAAVQLRRALEAAAARYEVAEKTLVNSIEKLIDEGHVTKAFVRRCTTSARSATKVHITPTNRSITQRQGARCDSRRRCCATYLRFRPS